MARTSARSRRLLILSLALVAASGSLYLLQAAIAPDSGSVWMGLLSQLAFLPLYFLFSTIVVDTALVRKEREDQVRRMNVLVGVFFREVGDRLLALSIRLLVQPDGFRSAMAVTSAWKEADFLEARRAVERATHRFDMRQESLVSLAGLLDGDRDALLRLMQTPGLLEHEGFTDLLLAVWHLVDELDHRPSFADLPAADAAHLEGDLRRAFALLSVQWLSYALHLKKEYPYLYSLVLRTGPDGTGDAKVV